MDKKRFKRKTSMIRENGKGHGLDIANLKPFSLLLAGFASKLTYSDCINSVLFIIIECLQNCDYTSLLVSCKKINKNVSMNEAFLQRKFQYFKTKYEDKEYELYLDDEIINIFSLEQLGLSWENIATIEDYELGKKTESKIKTINKLKTKKEKVSLGIRKNLTISQKRSIVKVYLNRVKVSKTPSRVAKQMQIEFDVKAKNIRRWVKIEELQPDYLIEKLPNSGRRLGNPGRISFVTPEIIRVVEDFVSEMYEKELLCTRVHIHKAVMERIGYDLEEYSITRLIQRCSIQQYSKTSKLFRDMKENELNAHEKKIGEIHNLPFVLIAAADEKPVRKLHVPKKSFCPSGQSK